MEGPKILDQLVNYLPLVMAVLLAMGLGKVLGNLINLATGKARKAAKATDTPIDDLIVGPIADKLDAFAADLADGKLDGKMAASKVRDIASQLQALQGKKK